MTTSSTYTTNRVQPLLTRLLTATIACLLLIGCAVAAEAPPTGVPAAPQVAAILTSAAQRLGWSSELTSRPDLRGRVWQIAASAPTELDLLQLALISVADSAGAPSLLDDLRAQGLVLGLYRGREAVISRPGDPLAHGRGIIAWRCGPYTLLAEDRSGAGAEEAIAAALADAAEAHNLCGLPASLVIRAHTDDLPGLHLRAFSMVPEMSQDYYDANAYGRVDFAFTLLDADGPHGEEDWFSVGPSKILFEGQALEFAVAAIQAATATLEPPPQAYVDRVIVVVRGRMLERLTGDTGARTLHLSNGEPLRITLPDSGTRIYVSDVVLISWTTMLGTWAHELGHTLYSKQASDHGIHRITDRYACRPSDCDQDDVALWDIMGYGSEAGAIRRTEPTHMSSYTKEAAGWLRYAPARLGETYTLMALEHQQAGDTILIVDDPLSDDPGAFYIVEARDGMTPFGAPSSGVMVYRVRPGRDGCGATLVALPEPPDPYPHYEWYMGRTVPTLYRLGDPEGHTVLELPGGLVVELLAESFAPYRVTVQVRGS
jgi:M6 family metalloprotease-like protein